MNKDGRHIVVINYCDEKFELSRKYNSFTAYKFGNADKVIEYSAKDIDNKYYSDNEEILGDKTRGDGFWLWKPYFIGKTLSEMKDGDYLMYVDAGAYFVDSIYHLIDCMVRDNTDVMCFELPLLQSEFTKMETMVNMGHVSDRMEHQILGGYLLIKNTQFSRDVIMQWRIACEDKINIKNKSFTDIKNPDYFISHREDQSVLSIICRKNGIEPYRDPSQFGDYPWMYAKSKKEFNSGNRSHIEFKEYPNSTYPRIIVSNRKVDPITYRKKMAKLDLLYHIGIMNKWVYKLRYNLVYKTPSDDRVE